MAELLGTHSYQLDPKGRVSLPAKFRAAFVDGCWITVGQDRCLYVFPRAEWQRRSDEVASSPLSDTDGRAYSQARLLRGRLRYLGEVRATGDVLVDMAPLLQRTGFSSAQLRADLTAAEREAYHAAMKDRVGPALDMLDARPLASLDQAERRLLNMCLSFAHIALAVEVQGPDEERHATLRQHMRITRSPADG